MKRILSIVLATVLMCSMMVTGASAAGKSTAILSTYADEHIQVTNTVHAGSQMNWGMPVSLDFGATIICQAPVEITTLIDLSDLKVDVYRAYTDAEKAEKESSVFGSLGSDGEYNEFPIQVKTEDRQAPHTNPFLKTGAKVVLTEPGQYMVASSLCTDTHEKYDNMECSFYATSKHFNITVVDAAAAVAMQTVQAIPTASKVLVNGVETAFESYTIDGYNYFKLRDIAYALNGTNRQFEVVWDNAKSAVSMTRNHAYTPVGGEMALGGGTAQTATRTSITTAKFYIDGERDWLSAYTIGGNNFVKLRELGYYFGFYVGWENDTVIIDTNKGFEFDY